jgi:uncharacterized protein YwgA
MYHKKMDCTHYFKKGKLLELQLMSSLEIQVKICLRNYMQKHIFITTNKKGTFLNYSFHDCNFPQTPTYVHNLYNITNHPHM